VLAIVEDKFYTQTKAKATAKLTKRKTLRNAKKEVDLVPENEWFNSETNKITEKELRFDPENDNIASGVLAIKLDLDNDIEDLSIVGMSDPFNTKESLQALIDHQKSWSG
jgi:hypothetical protein